MDKSRFWQVLGKECMCPGNSDTVKEDTWHLFVASGRLPKRGAPWGFHGTKHSQQVPMAGVTIPGETEAQRS